MSKCALKSNSVGEPKREILHSSYALSKFQFTEHHSWATGGKSLYILLFFTKLPTGLYWVGNWLPFSYELKWEKKKENDFFKKNYEVISSQQESMRGQRPWNLFQQTCTWRNVILWNEVNIYKSVFTNVYKYWNPSLRGWFLYFQRNSRKTSKRIFSMKRWIRAW